MGITWTDEIKTQLQQKEDFSLSDCNIRIYYTCQPDLVDLYSVNIPSSPFRKKESMAFIVMMLNTTNQNNLWQSIPCPMTFPRVNYNWCVTGENKQVNIK